MQSNGHYAVQAGKPVRDFLFLDHISDRFQDIAMCRYLSKFQCRQGMPL